MITYRERKLAILVVRSEAWSLMGLDDEFRDDEEIVTCAISANYVANPDPNWSFFACVSPRLKGDREFVRRMFAFAESGDILKYASDELKDDEEVVRDACRYSPDAVKYASDRIKADAKLVEDLRSEFDKYGDEEDEEDDEGLFYISD